MIYVPKTNKAYCVGMYIFTEGPFGSKAIFCLGYWPIPESFWPEVTISVLPPRSAHPNIKFACSNSEPLVIENLPFDKYELEPSPLTQYILSRKQPKTCWQVSMKSNLYFPSTACITKVFRCSSQIVIKILRSVILLVILKQVRI